MVSGYKSSVSVFQKIVNLPDEYSEVIIFRTLKSSPEDITSLISCTPGFAQAVIDILTDLLSKIEVEQSSENRVVD